MYTIQYINKKISLVLEINAKKPEVLETDAMDDLFELINRNNQELNSQRPNGYLRHNKNRQRAKMVYT